MATRLKDIAEAVGVSTVTVSKVLNNKLTISEKTRIRVLECAERLNYRTNLAAKGLATGQSRMIGLIVPEIVHGFFSEVAAGLSDHLRTHQYGLIIASSRDQPALEAEEIRQMLSRRVDALVVASCAVTPEAFASVSGEVPLILLDRRVPFATIEGFVGTDDVLAGRLATQHLIDIGCRRIAYVGGPEFSPTADREQGYLEVLREAGMPLRKQYIVHLAQNEEATHTMGAEVTRRLLRQPKPPDAVFCYNDAAAYGAMAAALEKGVRVPQDLALVGCGNHRFNEFLRIPLTSVDQHTAQLGIELGRQSLACIRSESGPASVGLHAETLIKPTLVARESTNCHTEAVLQAVATRHAQQGIA